ncbi:c-type cytochrome [Oceanisphaera pacifica]|uniref:C-type cytochrome n=1 Tax=Oceanisphaera pacifica TaxID=2818389 RepID=A0ABS3NHW5_9GAMM|nr:c-type cytochrome [Oceanisphaera pacifica]MBO1520120.1 c-type cytochrome [Oceanisphaera pacifica]
MKKLMFLASALALNAMPASADIPPQAAACIACHQTTGLGMPHLAPATAGMPATYIAEQIRHFQTGERKNAIMQPMVAALDEAGIKAVSEWFASLPLPQPVALTPRGEKAPQEITDLGEKLAYLGAWERNIPSCVSCHGPEGIGVGDTFPHLAGQHADYIESQLHAWQKGTRTGDSHDLMGHIAEKLTAEEITAVASYFANVETK